MDAHQAVQALLVDGASIAALVLDHLAARDLVSDAVVIEDITVGGDQDGGQAWTANVDSLGDEPLRAVYLPVGLL
ncbi:hypothetical protein [Pseudomonas aeruginosa]|uniref:hypothetical protein n=1 Tax=Pseudomonas aeruginosa TaxID=287 RepID=UPI0018699633|nr:hypothetical protein [Pseudomonas aeruginosa]